MYKREGHIACQSQAKVEEIMNIVPQLRKTKNIVDLHLLRSYLIMLEALG